MNGAVTQRYSPKRALWKSVTELGLAPRPLGALQRAGITTLLDLVRCSKAGLRSIKNVGLKDVMEIEKKLGGMGLSLGEVAKYRRARRPLTRR